MIGELQQQVKAKEVCLYHSSSRLSVNEQVPPPNLQGYRPWEGSTDVNKMVWQADGIRSISSSD